jgi:hypothetical protein
MFIIMDLMGKKVTAYKLSVGENTLHIEQNNLTIEFTFTG